jgi:hypothetical protein
MAALPSRSDVDLFGYGEGVIHLDAKIAHRALEISMP